MSGLKHLFSIPQLFGKKQLKITLAINLVVRKECAFAISTLIDWLAYKVGKWQLTSPNAIWFIAWRLPTSRSFAYLGKVFLFPALKNMAFCRLDDFLWHQKCEILTNCPCLTIQGCPHMLFLFVIEVSIRCRCESFPLICPQNRFFSILFPFEWPSRHAFLFN
jgi:hypothetical protein